MGIILKKAKPVVPANPPIKNSEYHWEKLDTGEYCVLYPNNDYGILRPRDNKWEFQLKIGGFESLGTRDTLEEAFKRLEDELYNKDKNLWLKSRGSVVIENYSGDIDSLFED